MSTQHTIRLTVNDTAYERSVPVRLTLADFLREELNLTGTHLGCEHGVCGACTILCDDEAVRSSPRKIWTTRLAGSPSASTTRIGISSLGRPWRGASCGWTLKCAGRGPTHSTNGRARSAGTLPGATASLYP